MSKFKAGDQALIVAAGCSENIGRVVELVQRYETDSATINERPFMTLRGVPAWHVKGDLVSSLEDSIGYGFFSESCLMPIRGNLQPEQQKLQEVPA